MYNEEIKMIKSKTLGPVYKYNIPYKMASGYMYKNKAQRMTDEIRNG